MRTTRMMYCGGRGITDMATRVVTATGGDQRKREERKADTDGAGLEASIRSDGTQIAGPEKPEDCEQSPPGRQLKPKPRPKPQPNQAPTPSLRTTSRPIAVMTLVPTPARRWEANDSTSPDGPSLG